MTPFDDLDLLRAFVCIVESKSISAAARVLKMPQPTLSRHLRTLEGRAGYPLLQRDTHRTSLTEGGARLLEDARAMLALAEEATERLSEDQKTLRGHLRVFATIDFGQSIVTTLISRFIQANPGITVELAYTNRPAVLIQGGHDVGVIAGTITDESVVAHPAGRIVRYLAAAPELVSSRTSARKPHDLLEWPWLMLAGGQYGGSSVVKLVSAKKESASLRVKPVMISEGVTSLRQAARTGLGVAVLPDWLARDDLATGALTRVLPQWNATELPVHVVHPAGRQLTARARAFVDFAVLTMTKEMHRTAT
jgi:DNA-binding transcriptional LysR family regulator